MNVRPAIHALLCALAVLGLAGAIVAQDDGGTTAPIVTKQERVRAERMAAAREKKARTRANAESTTATKSAMKGKPKPKPAEQAASIKKKKKSTTRIKPTPKPKPTRTPRPTPTPRPSPTPKPAPPPPPTIEEMYQAAITEGADATGRKSLKEAIKRYSDAASLKPNADEPHRLMARAWLDGRSTDQAAKSALRAYELDPNDENVDLLIEIAAACLTTQRRTTYAEQTRGYELLDRARARKPDDGELNRLLMLYHSGKGEWTQAAQTGLVWYDVYREEIASGATTATTILSPLTQTFAQALASSEMFRERLTSLEAAKEAPDSVAALDTMIAQEARRLRVESAMGDADTALRSRKYDEARALFREVTDLDPTNAKAWKNISTTYELEGKWDEACDAAVQYLAATGDSAAILHVISFVRRHVRNRQYDEALELLTPLRELAPKDLTVFDQLTVCYLEMKDYDKVIEAGENALVIYADHYRANPTKKPYLRISIDNLATAYQIQGRLAEIVEERQAALNGAEPSAAERVILSRFMSEMANSLRREGKHRASIVYLLQVAKLTPTDINNHRQTARNLNRDAGPNEAIEYLKGCLPEFPKDIQIHQDLASYLYTAEMYEEAEKAYRELARLEPGARSTHMKRVINCLKQLDKRQEAARLVEEEILAIEQSDVPERSKEWAISRLEEEHGDLLELTGLMERRLRMAFAAVGRDPKDPVAHDHLGDMYLKQGQVALALSEHLLAAKLKTSEKPNGDPQKLIDEAKRITNERRSPQSAIIYYEAVLDHFPTYDNYYHAMDQVLSLRRDRDFGRFALSAALAEGYRICEAACRRVIASEAPIEMKQEAEKRRVKYYYDIRPNEPKHWRMRRDEWLALGEREQYSEAFRREAINNAVELSLGQLEDPQAAYDAVLALAARWPDTNSMKRLSGLARELGTLPEPDPLRKYIADKPDDHEVRMTLAVWLWELGGAGDGTLNAPPEREEARRLIDEAPADIREQWAARGHAWMKDEEATP